MANNCWIKIIMIYAKEIPVIEKAEDNITPAIFFDDWAIFDAESRVSDKDEDAMEITGWVKGELTEKQFKNILDRYKPEVCRVIVDEPMNGIYGDYMYFEGRECKKRFLDDSDVKILSKCKPDDEYYKKAKELLGGKKWEVVRFD